MATSASRVCWCAVKPLIGISCAAATAERNACPFWYFRTLAEGRRQRRPGELSADSIQRAQERDDTLFFLEGEVERSNVGIQRWIAITSAVVVFNHVFKSYDAAVVHVGRRADDLPKGGRLEIANACAGIREFAVVPGDAGVVQTLVGEVGPT